MGSEQKNDAEGSSHEVDHKFDRSIPDEGLDLVLAEARLLERGVAFEKRRRLELEPKTRPDTLATNHEGKRYYPYLCSWGEGGGGGGALACTGAVP